MKEFYNCKEAVRRCIEDRTFSVAYLYSEEKTMDVHIHNCYEIYFSISGGKQFLIDGRCYDIEPGDAFVINQYESHYVKQVDSNTHERIVISIFPELLEKLSSAETDLGFCFRSRGEGYGNRIRLDRKSRQRFVYYAHKITSASGYGADLIEKAALIELMVLLNGKFREARDEAAPADYQFSRLAMSLIEYINANIGERLTLAVLANRFYVSESYLCRVFKSETGTTINKYLSARRISIAKTLLADGASVSEACEKSGFNDYVNFVKSFTRAVGLPPKRYAITSRN